MLKQFYFKKIHLSITYWRSAIPLVVGSRETIASLSLCSSGEDISNSQSILLSIQMLCSIIPATTDKLFSEYNKVYLLSCL